MNSRRMGICLVLFMVLPLWLVIGQAIGQISPRESFLPLELTVSKEERGHIQRQLSVAVRLCDIALGRLQAGYVDGNVKITVRDCYILIRSARQGIANIIDRSDTHKLPVRPSTRLAFERITIAWNLSRTPVDYLPVRGYTESQISRAAHNLSEAVKILQQVMILI